MFGFLSTKIVKLELLIIAPAFQLSLFSISVDFHTGSWTNSLSLYFLYIGNEAANFKMIKKSPFSSFATRKLNNSGCPIVLERQNFEASLRKYYINLYFTGHL